MSDSSFETFMVIFNSIRLILPIVALLFFWLNYREHRKTRVFIEEMRNDGESKALDLPISDQSHRSARQSR